MSPAILRGVMGSCLALGVADLAWLDVNAERMASAEPSAPMVRVDPLAQAPVIERLPAIPPPSPISDEVPAALVKRESQPPPSQLESCIVHFERGVSVVSDDQAKMLIPIADALKNDPRAVARVEGHADRTGWNGNTGSNLVLSDERAVGIVRALGKLGIPRSRIRAAAFGDTRPVDDRSTEEALRRNRRAEVRIERTIELTGDR